MIDLARKPLDRETKTALLREFRPFLHKSALAQLSMFSGRGYGNQDDWYQEAAIALFKAAEKYDPTRGIKFHTFATICVSRDLQRVRQNKGSMVRTPAGRVCPKNADRINCARQKVRLIEEVDVAEEIDDSGEFRDHVAAMLDGIDPGDADILRRAFGIGRELQTCREIAGELGLPLHVVRYRRARGLEALRGLP